MDPVLMAAWGGTEFDPAATISCGLMLMGLLVVTAGALLEHWTKRSNLITRALDRWSA